jgi:hypothetical protein
MPGLASSSAKYPKKPNDSSDPDFEDFKNFLVTLANTNHDPFDPLKLERAYTTAAGSNPALFPAFALTPLIFSAGPDRIWDLDEITLANRPITSANKPFALNAPGVLTDTNSDGDDSGSSDNITNHDLLTQ